MSDIKKSNNYTYENGLVFSGGAYRGMGQVGVLKALLAFGIKPDVISGTSAGALNAVLYANGYSPDEMYKIWKEDPFGQVMNLRIPKFGFLKPAKLGDSLMKYISYENLEELPLPVFITTSCLNTGEQAIFKEGNLHRLLEAACAVPVLFEPVEINGQQHVDGGLLSNLPVEPLRGKCERLIGVSVNPIPDKEKLDGFREILYRTIWMGIEGSVQKTREICDWFIAPDEIGKHGFVEKTAMDIFFQSGYEYTSRFLEEKLGVENQASKIQR